MLGTVDGTIGSLGVVLFIRPLTIPDPIATIVGPIMGSKRICRGRNRSRGCTVEDLLSRNLSLAVPIISM